MNENTVLREMCKIKRRHLLAGACFWKASEHSDQTYKIHVLPASRGGGPHHTTKEMNSPYLHAYDDTCICNDLGGGGGGLGSSDSVVS